MFRGKAIETGPTRVQKEYGTFEHVPGKNFGAAHLGPYCRLFGFLVSFFGFLCHGLQSELLLRQDPRLSHVGDYQSGVPVLAVYVLRRYQDRIHRKWPQLLEPRPPDECLCRLYAVAGISVIFESLQVSTVSERRAH